MHRITLFVEQYLENLHRLSISYSDVIEIFVIAFLVYAILSWIKETRAWALLKGIVVIGTFLLVAAIFEMTTILWIADKLFNLAIIAVVVILQPELRTALENLGRKNIVSSLFPLDALKSVNEKFSDKTISEIVRACVEMSRVKTGALIVVQYNQPLTEFERTGIRIDAIVSSQLLVNIFEHNTPLHDGAVIIQGDRITSATCYLPLSDSQLLSKELGTRHRAGVGISEVTDSLTIIVSEETGKISVAQDGRLVRALSGDELKKRLIAIQDKVEEEKKRIIWKGWGKNETK